MQWLDIRRRLDEERRRVRSGFSHSGLHNAFYVHFSNRRPEHDYAQLANESQEHAMSNKTKCRGSAVVEMGLVIIPLIFFLASTIELGRALWSYHTLATTIKNGVRFVVVHGARCVDASSACKATIGDTVQVMTQTGVGLEAAQMQLTFVCGSQTYTCSSAASCAGDETVWPPPHY